MHHTMYWLDAEGDRTGLEILVNSIPVERLMRTHGARLPINEFLLPGSNHVALRRSLWPSNKADEDGGDASIKLIAARFRTTMKLDERIVLEQAATFDTCPPRSVLVATTFAVDRAPSPPLAGPFDRIGAAEHGLILDRLGSIAALWQAGDGDGLVKWMGQYLGDYVRA